MKIGRSRAAKALIWGVLIGFFAFFVVLAVFAFGPAHAQGVMAGPLDLEESGVYSYFIRYADEETGDPVGWGDDCSCEL